MDHNKRIGMSSQESRQHSPSEISMKTDDIIVSKTDAESRITYVNQAFCNMSGYRENELIGQTHNIVRNVSMPHGIYNLMWEHLNAEEEFFGYIVNRNKDDSFYWSLINVTPFYEGTQLAGYFAVRRAPSENALNVIKPLYKNMFDVEKNSPLEQRLPLSSAVLWDAITKEYQSYAEYILSL
jgi:aerotaxis receptor